MNGDVQRAAAVEKILFHRTPVASLLAVHGPQQPEQALQDALKRLAGALLERRQRAQASNHHHQEEECSREAALLNVLGRDRLRKVEGLVYEVDSIRLERASLGCNGGVCLLGSNGLRNLPKTIPPQVRKIFFRNALGETYKNAPIRALRDQDWDAMMSETERDIKSYRDWSCRYNTGGGAGSDDAGTGDDEQEEQQPSGGKRPRHGDGGYTSPPSPVAV